MTGQLGEDAVGIVAGDCDAARAQDVYTRLHDLVAGATPENPVRLDLTDSRPTAFALQLLLAAAKSLDRRGAFAGFGPAAQAALGQEG
jgi:hypothetical protein